MGKCRLAVDPVRRHISGWSITFLHLLSYDSPYSIVYLFMIPPLINSSPKAEFKSKAYDSISPNVPALCTKYLQHFIIIKAFLPE